MRNLYHKILRLFLQKRGHGFDPDATLASVTPEDWVFGDGSLEQRFGAAPVIKANGQWLDVLPPGEIQKFNWGDTYHCTVYGTENAVQCMQIALYGINEEYTERFLGVLANIKDKVGGSPLTVAEMWRKNGDLPYQFLPFENVKSYAEFNSPKPMTTPLMNEARKWLDKWNFAHDTVWNFSHSNLKEVLKFSPIGVGVYAWSFDSSRGVYVKPSWATDNHWVIIVGYVEGQYWWVYDSYKDGGTFLKKLDWNYPFAFARRFYLSLKDDAQVVAAAEGKKLYDQLKGKHIIVPEKNGEIYHVRESYELYYSGWSTNSAWLQGRLDFGLRDAEKRKEFVGVSNDNFNKLLAACTLAGGGIAGKEDFASLKRK